MRGETIPVGTSPLLGHASPDAVIAYRNGRPIHAVRFLADAAKVARTLPDAEHVLNVCADRYRFAVVFAACLMTRRISLLPSTHTPEVIRRLAEITPDVFCITDDPGCSIDLVRLQFPDLDDDEDIPWRVPLIPTAQQAAIVFTSGSTGTPLPYRKTWGKLVRCVLDGAPASACRMAGRIHSSEPFQPNTCMASNPRSCSRC